MSTISGGSGWGGGRASDAFSSKKLLDLESNALQQIVAYLDATDRKSLVTTCSTLASIVRLQWKTLLVNVHADDAPPSGIAGFRCLETVIWADNATTPEEALEPVEWEANPELEPPDERNLPGLSAAQISRLQKVTDLVSKAVGQPRPASPDDMPFPDPSDLAAHELHSDLVRALAPTLAMLEDPTRHVQAFTERSLADQLAALGAGDGDSDSDGDIPDVLVSDDDDGALPDVFAPAPDSDDEEAVQQPQPQNAAAQNGNEIEVGSPVPAPVEAEIEALLGRPVRLVIAVPLLLPGRDFQTLMFRIRPVLEVANPGPGAPPGVALGALLHQIAAKARPLPLPFHEVDLGWFGADGHIAVQAVRGTVAWCPHDPALIDLGGDGQPSAVREFFRLRALRICVKNCESDVDETSTAFADSILPALTTATMPALRDLHLGRPFSFGHHIDIDLARLDLPHLTKLVINEMVAFHSFSQLTHLSSLKALAIGMPAAGFESQPQDLSSLSSLRDLRSLRVEFWQVEDPQDVAALQQLTELELQGMEGRVHLTKPNRPMPNLAGVALTRLPHHQDMRYREDSKFARWALRRAAGLFPGVEVLHLGTLGSAPNQVSTEAELAAAARVVDAHVRPLLAVAGRAGLQYLQLDTVLNITDDSLDKRCETGSVALPATLEVAMPVAALVETLSVCEPPPPPPPSPPPPQQSTETDKPQDVGQGGQGGEQQQQGQEEPQEPQQAEAVAVALDEEEDEEMEDVEIVAVGAGGPVVAWERTVEFVSCVPTDVLVAEFHYRRV